MKRWETVINIMPIIESIIDQHAEDAAFLWLQRHYAVHEPHYSLKDLTHLDDRIEAHLDGLRIAGNSGWEICKAALIFDEPGEVFVAAVLAFEGEDGVRVDEVVQAGVKSVDTWGALVAAMAWLSESDFQRWRVNLSAANAVEYRRLALFASVARRYDPGDALNVALNDDDLFYRARALRAAGELKRHDLLPLLQQQFRVDDPGCRFWAAWSALLLGDPSALAVVKQFVYVDSLFRDRALQLVLQVMESTVSQRWLKELAQQPALLRDVLMGAGIAGDPLYVPTLIKQMENPVVARVAGEAFTMITGIDFADEDMEGEPPEDFSAGPTEKADDADVAMDPDEELPWPEPVLVQKWWDDNQHRFEIGKRYLVGEWVTLAHCEHVLKNGLQRQRRAAALALALMQTDVPLFETRAPGKYQKKAPG